MGTRAVMEYHSTLRTMRAFNKTVNIKDFGVALEKSSENIQKIIEVIHFDKMSRPGTKYGISDYVQHSKLGPVLSNKSIKVGMMSDGSIGFIGNDSSKTMFNSPDLTIKTGVYVNRIIQQLDVFKQKGIELIDAMEQEAIAVNELHHSVQKVIDKINELPDIKDSEIRFHESNVNFFKIGYVDQLGLIFEVEETYVLDRKTMLYTNI
jgi:hypothetical protein